MLVIIGLLVFLGAAAVGVTAVMTNAGQAHLLSDHFEVLGYHVTGSTGTVFLAGMVVGAVAGAGLTVLVVGARRATATARALRGELKSHPSAVGQDPDAPDAATLGSGDEREATDSDADTDQAKEHHRFGIFGRRSPEKVSATAPGAAAADTGKE